MILLYLLGGAATQDMWDLKPDAPAEVRGEFKPIATSLPGVQICELLPLTAQRLHRACLLRTVTHGYNSHNPYGVLTGFTSDPRRHVVDYFLPLDRRHHETHEADIGDHQGDGRQRGDPRQSSAGDRCHPA